MGGPDPWPSLAYIACVVRLIAFMSPCRRPDSDHVPSVIDDVARTGHWSVVSGYLSSFVAVETGVGLQSCPWVIHVPPGRQANISVVSPTSRLSGSGAAGCQWTIVVDEANLTRHLSGCADPQQRRHHVLYTSHERGRSLRVFLRPTTTTGSLRSHLLLYFHGATALFTRFVNSLTTTVDIQVRYSYSIKHPVPDRVKPSFVFDIRAL